MSQRKIHWVDLMASFNAGDIAFVKSVLQAHEMPFYVEGENFALVRPLVQPAVIKVDRDDLKQAQELLQDFQGGLFGSQPDK